MRPTIALFLISQLILLFDMDIPLPPLDPFDSIANSNPSITVTDKMKLIQTGARIEPKSSTDESGGTATKPVEKPDNKKIETPLQTPVFPKYYDFFDQEAITTKDYASHHPWIDDLKSVVCSADSDDKGNKATAVTVLQTYENVSESCLESRFKCYTRMLLKHFHNNRMFDNEDLYYLLLFGDPAANYVLSVREFKDKLKVFCDTAIKHVDPESKPPTFQELGDGYGTMMDKISKTELYAGHPFTLSVPFARGLDLFPQKEVYGYVRRLLSDPNKRLARNAVYYLGMMQKYEPMEELFELLKNSKDAIEKARALYCLSKAEFQGLGEYLAQKVEGENDPVFQIAFVNSLAKLSYKGSFKILVRMLESAIKDGNYEKVAALTKASTKCLDPADINSVKKLYAISTGLKNNLDRMNWANDPLPVVKDTPVSSYRKNARQAILRQILDIVISVCGDRQAQKEYAAKLSLVRSILSKNTRQNMIKVTPRSVPRPREYALDKFEPSVRIFVIETLPLFGKLGRKILEDLILTAFEGHSVTYTALSVYRKSYPDNFPEFGTAVVEDSKLPLYLIERTFEYLNTCAVDNPKTKAKLDKILLKMSEDYMSEELEKQHLATISIYYRGLAGKLNDQEIIKMLEEISKMHRKAPISEQSRANASQTHGRPGPSGLDGYPGSGAGSNPYGQEGQSSPSDGSSALVTVEIKAKSRLVETLIEALAFTKSAKAETFLISLLDSKEAFVNDNDIKRTIVRSLSNFSSDAVKRRLCECLSAEDGWIRLISYLVLKDITGKELRTDWLYRDPKELGKDIQEYKRLIFN
ncbi:MAG: HEAT repeat domain-containing protein [Planctomycetes bacterium]|nr:HEAT repeat domain-containing protein [Planctomycetota bacterium]